MPTDPLRTTVALNAQMDYFTAVEESIADGVITPEEFERLQALGRVANASAELADGAVRGAMSVLRSGDYTPGLIRHHGHVLPPRPIVETEDADEELPPAA